MDAVDRRILDELERDGRLTQAALGARIGLSRSAVQERIWRLERDGHILGYTIRRNSPPCLSGVRAYVLVEGGASHDRAVQTLKEWPEIRQADSVSGDVDLVLQVEAEDLEHLNRLRDAIARLPGVTGTTTHLVMAARIARPDQRRE